MEQQHLYRIDPVNEILLFYDARIAPLNLFAYERLLELISDFGEKEVLHALRAAASKRMLGDGVLEWVCRRLTQGQSEK